MEGASYSDSGSETSDYFKRPILCVTMASLVSSTLSSKSTKSRLPLRRHQNQRSIDAIL